jgi:glycosyltransferase involved in cell wall biosynthesis
MVSIVIPTLGRASLERLLRSIVVCAAENNFAFGREFEVVVAVDPRGSLALESEFAEVRVVPSPGPGVNRARNAGARESRGDLIWFLDDDTDLLDHASLAHLPDLFLEGSVRAVGGDYVSSDTSALPEVGYNSFCSLWRTSAGLEDAEQLLGGTLAVRKQAWLDAGGFDDHIEYGGAETSFVVRLNRQPAGVELPRTKVRFNKVLNVRHFPGDRGVRGWARVAFYQGHRKQETESSLPSIEQRMRRTWSFLRAQEPRTLLSLAVFIVPFLAVSKVAAVSRR